MAHREVVYKPTSDFNELYFKVNDKITAIPPYDDSGVSFKGYYKIRKSENQFELKTQERFFVFKKYTGGSGTLYIDDTGKKRLYITDINIQFNIVTYNSLNGLNFQPISVDRLTTGSDIYTILFYGTSGCIGIHFDVPLMIDLINNKDMPSLKILATNNAPGGTDRIYYSICGFWEN